jgi:hypothetical protein
MLDQSHYPNTTARYGKRIMHSTGTIIEISWEPKIQSLADANEDKQVYSHVGLAVGDPKSPILME